MRNDITEEEKTFLILKHGDYFKEPTIILGYGADILYKIYSKMVDNMKKDIHYHYKRIIVMNELIFIIKHRPKEIINATTKVLREIE